MPAVIKNLSPTKPWQHAKQSALVFNQRLHGGGSWGVFYTSPWGTIKTFSYIARNVLYPHPPKPDTGSLEVGQAETDAKGFAIYGMVRVGGVSVIPLESES